MDEGHTVFIRRHGFLSSLVLGVCGVICITVICATAVGLYGLYIVDDKLEDLVGVSPDMIEALTDWQQALPPALADALNDHRDLGYRQHVDASVELVNGRSSRTTTPVIEVTNRGDKVITLLSLRVVVEDDDGIPIKETAIYAATPIAIDSDWRGPLLPGSKRRFAVRSSRHGDDADMASLEITELRVWNGEMTTDADEAEVSDEKQLSAEDAKDEVTDDQDQPAKNEAQDSESAEPKTDSGQDKGSSQDQGSDKQSETAEE